MSDATSTDDTGPRRGTGQRHDVVASELKGAAYELLILLLSILAIVNSVIVLLPLDGPIRQVAFVTDVILAPFFLFDFLYRLATASSRERYFFRGFGWADLIGAVPLLGFFRIFRVARVIRLLRRHGVQETLGDLDGSRATATFFFTVFLVLAVVEFAGMAVYVVEVAVPGSNIRSASDALWWGFVTVTTVGYGDQYPVTNLGRTIGTFLLFAGVALFSVLTGFIANTFLAPRRRRFAGNPLADSMEADLAELRKLLEDQEDRATAIRLKLGDVERAVARKASAG